MCSREVADGESSHCLFQSVDCRGARQGAEAGFSLRVQKQQGCQLALQYWSSERSLESREDGGWHGMAEIQRYLPGKVGESWSTDEAFEPNALERA